MLGKALTTAAAGSAAGGAAAGLGIEDVFSTWLYTGNSSTNTITNGIDVSGEGGLVWIKGRQGRGHHIYDTERGAGTHLSSSSTAGTATYANHLTAFNSDGFTLGYEPYVNNSGETYASWTFRKAPGFFDVVTWTGNATDVDASRTISHSLGSVPGTIIVKRTDGAADWQVYHRSLGATKYLNLNQTSPEGTSVYRWRDTAPTSSVFTVGYTNNASGNTYVAYLFAHDEAIFGESADQSVIKCGSYTGNGSASGPTVNLGWEPQFIILKNSDNYFNWWMFDTMRGIPTGGNTATLSPMTSDAETLPAQYINVTPTGFQLVSSDANVNVNAQNYIYIAIRRGPMKTPTDATEVFESVAYTGDQSTNQVIGSTVLVDAFLLSDRDATSTSWVAQPYAHYFFDRLRGYNSLSTASTGAESPGWSTYLELDINVGWDTGTLTSNTYLKKTSTQYVSHNFRRAPGFFDVVAYTAASGDLSVKHNLGVRPEFLIIKGRNYTSGWVCWHSGLGEGTATTKPTIRLDQTNAIIAASANIVSLSTTDFVVGNGRTSTNNTTLGGTYIAYLFATLPGVSKVGSYTGTGTTLSIDCGFTAGARFVMIKRTDASGDWYTWDTARGIVSGNDPYLLINSTAAEVTTTDYIDPLSSGFQISSSAPAAINASGGSYIFLAIA